MKRLLLCTLVLVASVVCVSNASAGTINYQYFNYRVQAGPWQEWHSGQVEYFTETSQPSGACEFYSKNTVQNKQYVLYPAIISFCIGIEIRTTGSTGFDFYEGVYYDHDGPRLRWTPVDSDDCIGANGAVCWAKEEDDLQGGWSYSTPYMYVMSICYNYDDSSNYYERVYRLGCDS